MNHKTLYIIDTGAFIKGMDVSVLDEYECYTTPEVLTEIKNSFVKQKIDTAILSGNLKISSPEPEDMQKVKNAARKTGDYDFLSETDVSIISLALTLRNIQSKQRIDSSNLPSIEVVTDDYSIQNVLNQLSITSLSYLKKGIKNYIQWEIYCPACKTVYTSIKNPFCTKCEIRLKRRPIDTK